MESVAWMGLFSKHGCRGIYKDVQLVAYHAKQGTKTKINKAEL
jgi:hypothetical protein